MQSFFNISFGIVYWFAYEMLFFSQHFILSMISTVSMHISQCLCLLYHINASSDFNSKCFRNWVPFLHDYELVFFSFLFSFIHFGKPIFSLYSILHMYTYMELNIFLGPLINNFSRHIFHD